MKVGIGTITKDRAEMLAKLFSSYKAMKLPVGVEILYIVVENEEQSTVDDTINSFRKSVAPYPVIFQTEARPGIPLARNKVLDIALSEGCDYLTFVDDDETVSTNWLEEILSEITSKNLDLVGGPLEIDPPSDLDKMSKIKKLLFKSIVVRNAEKQTTAIKHKKDKNYHQLGIFTNNWIVKLDFCRNTGIRFDDSIGLAGGSDRRFLDEAIKANARTGWAENARVLDFLPPKRLSVLYQIKRRRDQIVALNKTRVVVQNYKKPTYKYLYSAVYRSIRSFISLFLIPFNPSKYFNKCIEFAGTASGNFYIAMGWEPKHYA